MVNLSISMNQSKLYHKVYVLIKGTLVTIGFKNIKINYLELKY